MNILRKNCQLYAFKFPEPISLRDVFFAPRRVIVADNTVTERIQRWLIDHGSFADRACKGFHLHVTDSRRQIPFTLDNADKMVVCKSLHSIYFSESLAGRCVYDLTTSIVLRFIQLSSEGARHSLNFSTLSPKTKQIIDLLIIPAVFIFTCYLGYDWKDIALHTIVPIILEKILSFKLTNYFKQIHTLSSTKDFVLKDFITKNIQSAIIRNLIPIAMFLRAYSTFSPRPNSVAICKIGENRFEEGYLDTYYSTNDLFLEPILLMLGKMTFDLTYILILKTLSPNADLRDPMGWMFSILKRQTTTTIPKQVQKSSPKNNLNKQVPNSNQYEILSKAISMAKPDIELSESKDYITENQEPEYIKKSKIKTHRKSDAQPASKKNNIAKAKESQTEINIEVGGWPRSFQKIEDTSLNTETWAVIIADSVEKQKLKKYEKQLSNGIIGGSTRQLKGWSDRYEIGANMDSRLIGKMYHSGVYNSLQSFMHMEDALQVSQELEKNGIPDNVSLIVFSTEAKTHNDIARVASKL